MSLSDTVLELRRDNIKTALYGLSFILSIPAIILIISFIFWPFSLIFENQRGLSVLLKSKNLFSGRFLAVLWRFLISGLILLLILSIIGVITAFLGNVIGNQRLLTTIAIDIVFNFFILPLLIIYAYVLYKNLVQLKNETAYLPKRRTKIIFSILSVLGMPLVIFVVIFSFLGIMTKDIKPIDDSDLLLSQPNIDILDQDNAFFDFYKISESSNNDIILPSDKERGFIDNIIKGEDWNGDLVRRLINENVLILNYFENGVTKSSFQDPTYQNFKQSPSFTDKIYVWSPSRLSFVARLNTIKAITFLKEGKEEETFEQIFKVLKMGQMIKSSDGSLLVNLIGRSIKEIGFEGLRTIIMNSNNLPKEQLAIYLNKLNDFKESKSGLINAFRFEYMGASWSKKCSMTLSKIESQKTYLKNCFFLLLTIYC